jgi:hypothetical protein
VRRVGRKSKDERGDEMREHNNYRGGDRREHKKRVKEY